MKDKGFTLVELLVAISLLALLTVIAIPTLRAFQTSNSKKQYESYANSVTSSAKLYNDAYSDDLFGNLDSGCQKVTLTEMINKDMAKDIALKDITCNKTDSDSYALVWKFKDEYSYNSIVHCFNSNGVSQYNSGEAEAENCLSTTKKPELSVTVNQNEDKTSKKKSLNIILSDDFGFTANQEIEYLWSTTKNETGEGLGTYTKYKYNNSYIKRVDKTVTLTSNSITIPGTTTGNYYLYIRPIKVLNIVNENLTGVKRFGPFRFDHTPPTCPTVKAVDSSGKNIAKNTQAHIDHFTIDYGADDLQYYEIKVSYDNGAHYSNAVTKSSSINTYTPTGDGQIKIMTRAKDLANNQSDWCTSDMFINDNTPPNAPTVTGYKKGSVTDISSKGNLGTHPTDTWLKGWVFTQATGSTDTYSSVTYHYSAEGTTTNTKDTVASYRNVNAEGTSTVRFWACDAINNCSGKVTYKVKLDRTAPNCGTATGASTTWTNSNRTIKQACTETGGSGCVKSSYDTTYSSGTTSTSSVLIKDIVGNEKTCSYNVYVDKTAPTCGTATGASNKWAESRTVKQACSDSGSGCEKSSYDKAYTTKTTTDTVTIKDKAGNPRKCTYNVYVDPQKTKCGKYVTPYDPHGNMYIRSEPDWGRKGKKWCAQGDDGNGATCSGVGRLRNRGQSGYSAGAGNKWLPYVVCDSDNNLKTKTGDAINVTESSSSNIYCYMAKDTNGNSCDLFGGCIYNFVKIRILIKDGNTFNPNLLKLNSNDANKFSDLSDTDDLVTYTSGDKLYGYFYGTDTYLEGVTCPRTSKPCE